MGELSENDRKKQELKSYQKHKRREAEILEEIQRLRMDKMFPSLAADGMPRGSSQSDLSNYAALIDEQIELLKEERLERAKAYTRIENAIRRMRDDDEQKVLRLRYIQGLKWEEVAVEMNISWQHTHKIHARALKNFNLSEKNEIGDIMR